MVWETKSLKSIKQSSGKNLPRAVSPHGKRQCWEHIWKEEIISQNKKPEEETGEIEWSKAKAFVIIPLRG